MKFSEILHEASARLQREGRLRYRSLQHEFDLDDQGLADLRDELIEGQRVALDEEGKVLGWVGDVEAPSTATSPPQPQLQTPASYTPLHLAQRIRAEQAAMEARGVTAGERKTITALFADIQDSTALIADLDPEAARRLIDPALQLMKAPRRSGRRLRLPLAGLFFVGLLAQCTPRPPARPAQVQERTPTQVLSPEEQLELFNTYLDRG